ncbi:hypothetical protein HOLleu_25430 [Holothuria leucospilota]|uniref:Reverse transcriptase domain-containing protein n=1 Tax=Holothuria leucospilota TaxID=206669 RepID=A0A9Q1H4I7_HOLLE|nr:hypothetical protein HOLleu_25430 [Holothuria leucospilota]
MPPCVDRLSLRESISTFERNLRLAEFFYSDGESDEAFDNSVAKFREKSSWSPPPNRDKFLDAYVSVITNEIMNAPEQRAFSNLSVDERAALNDLKANCDIVIREADKGSAVVVMDRDLYIKEGYRQLDDPQVYERVSEAVLSDIESEIAALAGKLYRADILTEDMFKFAIRTDTRPARFYLLPKVHKPGVPGRPVVSACGSATEGLSEIVDHFLQPFVPSIPSYIKDTEDFIRKVHGLGPIPHDAFLVTIDVVDLYPSILHNDGISALRTFLSERHVPRASVNGICDMCEIVLKRNVFEFNSEFFLQTSGTAIGTKMAPAYANIFMGVLERDLLAASSFKPEVWFRFIDDIFMIWTHGREKLMHFLQFINSAHPCIKFTCDYSLSSVHFLDVQVSTSQDGGIVTDLYTKPTDTHQFLLATSCHPNHTKRSIPYSQALRILRICSSIETARERCRQLSDYLLRRGYNRRRVQQQVDRAFENFTTPMTPKISKGKPLFFTVQYHPALPDIKGILTKFLPLLHQSDRLKLAVPAAPVMSFSQPPNLKRSLCRAKLLDPSRVDLNMAVVPCRCCAKNRCQICGLLVCSDVVMSNFSGKNFKCKNSSSTCDSLWVIYVISCLVCQLQYVGRSNNFRLRINGHKSDFRLYRAGTSNKLDSKILYDHLIFHNCESFKVQIVDRIFKVDRDKGALEKLPTAKEREWIWKLDTVTPKGLNMDDGFYCQNKHFRIVR